MKTTISHYGVDGNIYPVLKLVTITSKECFVLQILNQVSAL